MKFTSGKRNRDNYNSFLPRRNNNSVFDIISYTSLYISMYINAYNTSSMINSRSYLSHLIIYYKLSGPIYTYSYEYMSMLYEVTNFCYLELYYAFMVVYISKPLLKYIWTVYCVCVFIIIIISSYMCVMIFMTSPSLRYFQAHKHPKKTHMQYTHCHTICFFLFRPAAFLGTGSTYYTFNTSEIFVLNVHKVFLDKKGSSYNEIPPLYDIFRMQRLCLYIYISSSCLHSVDHHHHTFFFVWKVFFSLDASYTDTHTHIEWNWK